MDISKIVTLVGGRAALSVHHRQPSSPVSTYQGKVWAQLTTMEKHRLFNDNRPLYEALKSAGASAPALAPPAGGKTWEQLTRMERHRLFNDDRPRYDALKGDFERRSGKGKAGA
jgi:hypothetical protein